MSKIMHGGPAHPFEAVTMRNMGSPSEWTNHYGVTKRDYFAAKSISPVMAMTEWSIEDAAEFIGVSPADYDAITHWPQVVAKLSYQMADAMLKAREVAID